MARKARVSRLLEMVTLLQSGTGWNAKALAERFGVSRTRVFNDVRALREAGVPVQRSRSGYKIAESFFLSAVRLAPQEALALLFPRELFGGWLNREVCRSAQEKVLSCLPPPLRAEAEKLMKSTDVQLPVSAPDSEVFEQVRKAVVEQRRIAIVYSGRQTDRLRRLEIHPYGIALRKHAWYVVAYSVAHREVRKFRVSRIGAVERTPLHFTVPKDFSLDAAFEGAWYVFGGEPQEIGVRFSPPVARLVRERVPHPGQRIQTLKGGWIFYRASVRNLDEVAWWLVQYGGEAVVSYPVELRDKVLGLAASTLEAYGIRAGRRPRLYPRVPEAPTDLAADSGSEALPPSQS